jgi:propanol-preferring alcohol dehydrogenase
MMQAMVIDRAHARLRLETRPLPQPTAGEILVAVEACAICRTDLHVIDGDLANPKFPLIPGHEVVGRVAALGAGVTRLHLGQRIGAAWLARACGTCSFCRAGRENLCESPEFNGYTRDGGFASHMVADADFVFSLAEDCAPVATAPLMCAGLIGWRSLKRTGDARRVGIFGFGAAAHIMTQICRAEQRDIYAFTRPGDEAAQMFARSLGAIWAGGTNQTPPDVLDAAIIFAPAGDLVPLALSHIRKGGCVVCGGIHMSDIPAFPYGLLWGEREIASIANLTRRDGAEFFEAAARASVVTRCATYPLQQANEAVADLRAGRIQGAAVLVP